jgi:ABC-2 type transport system ATP-binding protein
MTTVDHEPDIISADHLSRAFKKVTALRDIDLRVQRGEIFGLVGPDGAGKTTMLRLLAAVMTPTSGSVTVAGHDSVKDAEEIRAHVGYMPQKFSLYGDLSVRENLEFYADIFGVHGDERQRRFEQVLSFAHMSTITDRRAKQLSGGMQKKLGLACTLIHRPEMLLLDEPTTGVDPVSRREFWDLLTELHIQGTTIVVSTPYMDEAERCNRIGLLFKGQLIECGTPREITMMVKGQVVEFHPDRLETARALLAQQPDVLEIQVYGTLLHIFVQDATVDWPRLHAALGEAGVNVDHVRLIHPRMEEAFISLLRAR